MAPTDASEPDTGHRIRADCQVCRTSHLAHVPADRVSPDPATRAEAVGDSPENWENAPPRLSFHAPCPQCGETTPHQIPKERYTFPGGFAVPTTHDRAEELQE